MMNEGSGAATKNTQSVYERHAKRARKATSLYEKQRSCTKSNFVARNRSPLTANRSSLNINR